MKTFDEDVYDDISAVFKKSRRNPNGAPIAATLYVTNTSTDYCAVRRLYDAGHEIASHGLDYMASEYAWSTANQSTWVEQLAGQRLNIAERTQIPETEIHGARAPYLAPGGDVMLDMMRNAGFAYDSTLPFAGADANNSQGWPLTLDFVPGGDECSHWQCPSRCHHGLWEVPIRRLLASDNTTRCTQLDFCEVHTHVTRNKQPLLNETLFLFRHNFYEYYNANKAPVVFSMNTEWFAQNDVLVEALNEFLDEILTNDDVYVITTWQALQWIREPTPLANLTSFQPWAQNKRQVQECSFDISETRGSRNDGVAADDVAVLIEDTSTENFLSGNTLVVIEILVFVFAALVLIARDNHVA